MIKKLTKSQLSPTHASTKRKITDELKHNAKLKHNARKLERSKVNVTRLHAETESVSPTNFKLGRQLEHALSTAPAAATQLVNYG